MKSVSDLPDLDPPPTVSYPPPRSPSKPADPQSDLITNLLAKGQRLRNAMVKSVVDEMADTDRLHDELMTNPSGGVSR